MRKLFDFWQGRPDLSRVFFYALVFLLPLQTRKIFFTDQSFIGNYFSFYNTFYLYLTDLLFFGIIIAWIWEFSREKYKTNKSYLSYERNRTDQTNNLSHETNKNSTKNAPTFHRLYTPLLIFWLILAISVIVSRESFSLSAYGFVKITQFILLFAYILKKVNVSREISRIFWLILASAWIQAGIGIYQYVFQRSLDFRLIGEEFLRPGLSGVAEFVSREIINPLFYEFFPYLSPVSDGIMVNIRAYGTFPHPNVLAGFLFMALLVNLYLLSREISMSNESYLTYKSNGTNGVNNNISREISQKWLKIGILAISLILICTGLVVTFSRFAWLVAGLSVLIWLILYESNKSYMSYRTNRNYRTNLAFIVFIPLVALALNWALFSAPIKDRVFGVEVNNNAAQYVAQYFDADESFSQRYLLNVTAWEMIKERPLTGVGLKQFISQIDEFSREKLLPFQHQPAHNMYLLIAAESGVLALLVFLIFLYNIVRPQTSLPGRSKIRDKRLAISDYTLLIIVFGFLAIGMTDHYLWTIQQGALLFWIALGLVSARNI